MDASTLKWVIPVFIAIISAVMAVVNYKRQTKTRIFFFEQQKINLYDDVVKNIDGLKITYKELEINKLMFLMRGIFICAGNKDIVKADVNKGVMVNLNSTNSRWLDYTIIKKTDSLEINSSLSGNTILIDFSLMKDSDYFILECIGEADKSIVSFDHRIANVDQIKTKNIKINQNIIGSLTFGLFFLILGSFLFYTDNPFQKLNITDLERVGEEVKIPSLDFSNYHSIDSLNDIRVSLMDIADSLFAHPPTDSTINLVKRIIHVELPPLLSKVELLRARQDSLQTSHNQYKNIYHLKDSVMNIAAKEYTAWDLLFGTRTKKYYIRDIPVSFRLRESKSFSFIMPVIILLTSLILIFPDLLQYIQYRRVGKIAVKRMSIIS